MPDGQHIASVRSQCERRRSYRRFPSNDSCSPLPWPCLPRLRFFFFAALLPSSSGSTRSSAPRSRVSIDLLWFWPSLRPLFALLFSSSSLELLEFVWSTTLRTPLTSKKLSVI